MSLAINDFDNLQIELSLLFVANGIHNQFCLLRHFSTVKNKNPAKHIYIVIFDRFKHCLITNFNKSVIWKHYTPI